MAILEEAFLQGKIFIVLLRKGLEIARHDAFGLLTRAEEERRRTEEEMRRIADIKNASKMAEIGDMFDDSSDDFDLGAAGPRRTRRKRNRKRTRRKKSLPGNRRRRRNASSRRKRGRR